MRILVTNDDGIQAEGLRALVSAFAGAGHEITVSAPDSQRSAASHSLSIARPFSVRRAEVPGAVQAWAIGGTPADCVKTAIRNLAGDVQFVLSGINHGYNLGTDVLYSGTVAAAMEGALCGLPAMAVSLARGCADFGKAADMALRVFRILEADPLPPLRIANLNVPAGEIAGLKTAPLCVLRYDDLYVACGTENAEQMMLTGSPAANHPVGDDDYSWAQKGYATLTILSYDLADAEETARRQP